MMLRIIYNLLVTWPYSEMSKDKIFWHGVSRYYQGSLSKQEHNKMNTPTSWKMNKHHLLQKWIPLHQKTAYNRSSI